MHPPLALLPLLLVLQLLPPIPAEDACPFTPRRTRCLPTLATRPELYADCLTTPCFLFISEPPFTILPSPLPSPPYTPFPCANPAPYSGLSFAIHKLLPPALCVYAGPDCSFNDLVHFTAAASNHTLAITGLLIQTPQRLCRHKPSSSIVDDSMVIIGNAETSRGADQLIRPFSGFTWLIIALCVTLILLVAFCIAFASRGKPSFATALMVAAGDSSAVLKNSKEEDKFAVTRYTLSMTLVKISVASLITLLALFYEAGVVNFLFQENTGEIGKRVRRLSPSELRKYSVLRDSALERVWNETVNPTGDLYDPVTEQPPWRRCDTAEECVRWVADTDSEVMFDVTFAALARFLIQQVSSCRKLSIFETGDILYQFSGGMLFNENVSDEYRRTVNRRLIGSRINGTLANIIDENLDRSACHDSTDPQLGPELVIIPLAIVVFPPLLASIVILFFAKRKLKPRERVNSEQPAEQPMPSIEEGKKKSEIDLSRVSSQTTMQRGSTIELDEITPS